MPPQPGVRALGESTRIDTHPTTSADFVVASNIGGIALDTNLLTRPTQRRLVALWCEQAGQKIAVLPQVRNELMQRGVRTGRSVAVRIEAWKALLEEPATPYRPVSLDGPDADLCEQVLTSLTVPCFPQLSSADEIPANSDAVIIAESVACGMKMLVTNNMRSLDHAEVNGLVKELWGRDKLLVHADAAMVDAHQHGEAARELLRLALASCWPEQEPSSPSHADLRAVEGRVASLCDRPRRRWLAHGVGQDRQSFRDRRRSRADRRLGTGVGVRIPSPRPMSAFSHPGYARAESTHRCWPGSAEE